jgi:NDP-sugar pyrophosphorylase family protein
MDAVILAAGFGTRLRPYTLDTPKPLLQVAGRPILDWTLGALPRVVDRVIVVVHYLAEQFDRYLRAQQHRAEWLTVLQQTPRGTGDALQACREQIRSERFLVISGDDLYGARDLAALARCSAGILVHPVDEPRRFGITFVGSDGFLERLVEKPDLDGRQLANTGAYLFPRAIFDEEAVLSKRGEYEITDQVSALAARQPVAVIQASFWLPISTVEIWQQAQTMSLREYLEPKE